MSLLFVWKLGVLCLARCANEGREGGVMTAVETSLDWISLEIGKWKHCACWRVIR